MKYRQPYTGDVHLQAGIRVRIPVLDFKRHLIRKFSNLNDAHLVLGMDTDSGPETVHIHRGKIRQLAGNIATTEIPSLGGEVCISTDTNHTADNVMADIRINRMGHENEAVAGQWTVAGHVYEDESVASDILVLTLKVSL